MKNVKIMVVLSGLLIGAGIRADECSGSGVTIRNKASVPGFSPTLFVNIGDKPSKSEAKLLGSGYKKLKADKAVCFKDGFKNSKTLFVREAHEKGKEKNQAYQFNVGTNFMVEGINEINVVSGQVGFELELYSELYSGQGPVETVSPVRVVDVK